ncbi:MAG: hypothetical protein RDU20_22910 [Desulfomonilaceae bacterium]|nr:hypothetical protein [Desulfomonilaceae bacterium]
MSERERILHTIKAHLREIPGMAVVTRSLRKAASVNEMPSVALIDLGDKTVGEPFGPLVTKLARIKLSVVYHGTSEEKAPEEIGSFSDDIRGVMLGDELRHAIGTTVRACLYETSVSEIFYPRETSGKIVRQEIDFEVMYVADLGTI